MFIIYYMQQNKVVRKLTLGQGEFNMNKVGILVSTGMLIQFQRTLLQITMLHLSKLKSSPCFQS